MSDEANREDDSLATDEAVVDAELDDSPADAEPKKRRSGGAISWLALLLSAAAFALVGYGQFVDWRAGASDEVDQLGNENRDSIVALQRELTNSTASIDDVRSQLQALPTNDAESQVAALREDLEQQLRILNSLPSRMASIESSVASLAGISAGARQTFLLAEAEYYLQIANAQLQLANNPQLAALALGMADERVTQLSDPALIDARRAIANELAALEVMEKPDLAGATLTLASLARVVESLPLAVDRQNEEESDDVDEDQSGDAKAWGSVKYAMSGLVKVTPPEQAKLQMLSPDAEYFLRNNMAMQLQAARLALLRGEQTIFEQALDDTNTLLTTYFDTQSAQVIGAQQTLAEIRDGLFTTAAPDISNSLRLLRQYRALSESNE